MPDPQSIIQHILDELRDICGQKSSEVDSGQSMSEEKGENEFHDIYVAVESAMGMASKNGKRIVIIIDGLDKVTASTKTAKVRVKKHFNKVRFFTNVYSINGYADIEPFFFI